MTKRDLFEELGVATGLLNYVVVAVFLAAGQPWWNLWIYCGVFVPAALFLLADLA